jgi:hypothetical protein
MSQPHHFAGGRWPRRFLTGDDLAAYNDYIELRSRAWREGWHHWHRIAQARDWLEPVEVQHAIPYTRPGDPDGGMSICHPSGWCVAELMAGNIHPPIDAILGQRLLLIANNGEHAVVDYVDAEEWRRLNGPIKHEAVVDNRRAHTETAGPMTYEQAIEWIVMKDVPSAVWSKRHNRLQFAIVPRSAIPSDRSNRNAWRLADVDMEQAA